MSNRHLYILTGVLFLVGLSLFIYKIAGLGFSPLPAKRTYLWDVEARLVFEAKDEPIRITLYIPRNSQNYIITNENFISRGYGVSILYDEGSRKANWTIRKAKGAQSLYYKASIRLTDREFKPQSPSDSRAAAAQLEGAFLEAALSVISEIRQKSADTDSLTLALLQKLNDTQPDDNISLLLGSSPNMKKKAVLAVALLDLAGIRSRSVHGIRLEEQSTDTPILHWLEVYDQNQWNSYNPENVQKGVPREYFPWWRGTEPLVISKGTHNLTAQLSVVRNEETATDAAIVKTRLEDIFLSDYSLFSLPIQTQGVYRVILLIPVGVFLLVILRNVVGLRTFGTFMPVLISLAFRETQILWGVFLFTILVLIGLAIRLYLEQLKLLVVPRLAAILIVVIIMMVFFSVLTNRLGLERGLSVALFPMVILTMTIERMSIVWEELGPYDTFKQGFGSILAAVLAYLIMSIKIIEHIVFVFPELLLILLAITLLLGRYSGYRLLEYRRFKSLFKSENVQS